MSPRVTSTTCCTASYCCRTSTRLASSWPPSVPGQLKSPQITNYCVAVTSWSNRSATRRRIDMTRRLAVGIDASTPPPLTTIVMHSRQVRNHHSHALPQATVVCTVGRVVKRTASTSKLDGLPTSSSRTLTLSA